MCKCRFAPNRLSTCDLSPLQKQLKSLENMQKQQVEAQRPKFFDCLFDFQTNLKAEKLIETSSTIRKKLDSDFSKILHCHFLHEAIPFAQFPFLPLSNLKAWRGTAYAALRTLISDFIFEKSGFAWFHFFKLHSWNWSTYSTRSHFFKLPCPPNLYIKIYITEMISNLPWSSWENLNSWKN